MKAMYDLQKQRGADVKDMSAVDAVKSYQAVIEAHETGMSKFVPAFQSLYDSRSDSQTISPMPCSAAKCVRLRQRKRRRGLGDREFRVRHSP